MNHTFLRRAIVAGLAVGALAAPLPGSAQDSQSTVVAELVVVAPASGPAWWKVSKGDASVWILGLPSNTPIPLKWDRSTLERRLKSARLVVGVYNEHGRFEPGTRPPPLPPELKEEVAKLAAQLGLNRSADSFGLTADRPGPPMLSQGADRSASMLRPAGDRHETRLGYRPGGYYNVKHLLDLRSRFALSFTGPCFCALKQLNEITRRAGVPRVTPPVHSYTWEASALGPENPGTNRCLRAIITEVSVPRERYEAAAALWAKGDVRGMLAVSPPGLELDCEFLWPGSRERTIAFQTSLIAQALDRPGKVIAAANISDLVAEDGILERLRAQGFTIADPSKPLEE